MFFSFAYVDVFNCFCYIGQMKWFLETWLYDTEHNENSHIHGSFQIHWTSRFYFCVLHALTSTWLPPQKGSRHWAISGSIQHSTKIAWQVRYLNSLITIRVTLCEFECLSFEKWACINYILVVIIRVSFEKSQLLNQQICLHQLLEKQVPITIFIHIKHYLDCVGLAISVKEDKEFIMNHSPIFHRKAY